MSSLTFVLCSYLCCLLHFTGDNLNWSGSYQCHAFLFPASKGHLTMEWLFLLMFGHELFSLITGPSSSEPPDTVLSYNPLGGSRVELWLTTIPSGWVEITPIPCQPSVCFKAQRRCNRKQLQYTLRRGLRVSPSLPTANYNLINSPPKWSELSERQTVLQFL